MIVLNFIGVVFTQIEVEYFKEDIVREHTDSDLCVESACPSLLGNHPLEDLLIVTYIGLP